MITERLNSEQTKWLKEIELGTISVSYTKHAITRGQQKGIQLLNFINVKKGSVVEVERQDNKTTKLVVRVKYNQQYDLVLVIIPLDSKSGRFLALTNWLNHKDDKHKTLNKNRLGLVS